MSGKRQATSNLNHENWDQEEEPEERGTFRKASDNELKNRVIKKARRKVAGTSGADTTDDGAPKSVFSGFAGFGKPSSTAPAPSPFSFLSKISTPLDSNNAKSNTTFSFGSTAKAPEDSDVKSTATFSFGSTTKAPMESNTAKYIATSSFATLAPADSSNVKNSTSFSLGAISKSPVSPEIKNNETGTKETSTKGDQGKSESYQNKIKSLNQAVTKWIKTHVDNNPLCILSPIFKDYEKYITEIEEEEKILGKSSINNALTNENKLTSLADKFSASPPKLVTKSASGDGGTFSFGSNSSPTVSANSSSIFTSGSKPSTDTTKTNTFTFGLKSSENNSDKDAKASQGISFGVKSDDKTSSKVSTAFTFGKPTNNNGDAAEKPAMFSFTPGSAPFSFGNIKPPAPSTSDAAKCADDEEDQPPKVEFKQVLEEDAVYSKKCKVFVKKDGAYAERGVGTLYLKPVKGSEKMQLLVRADTNLGNILVNLILSTGIPTQRMGKNNVMMVCLPTPDVEKATSMLLRVKTAEEADELLAELEKYKK